MQATRRALCAALGLAGLACRASAAPATQQAVKLQVGSTAGGPVDVAARVFAAALEPALDRRLLVVNRPGASGTLAARAVANEAAGESGILVSGAAATVVAPLLRQGLGYDAERDLVPAALIGQSALVLVVHPALPCRTLQELVAFGQRTPGRLKYGSAGTGSTSHLCTMMLAASARMSMLHIPYQGDSQAQAALLAGDIHLTFLSVQLADALVASGRLRALGLTSAQRDPAHPGIPTFAESGLDGVVHTAWIAAFVSRRAPPEWPGTLNAAWAQASRQLGAPGLLRSAGLAMPEEHRTVAELQQFIDAERQKLAGLVRATGLREAFHAGR